jgi:hypothetical protein
VYLNLMKMSREENFDIYSGLCDSLNNVYLVCFLSLVLFWYGLGMASENYLRRLLRFKGKLSEVY